MLRDKPTPSDLLLRDLLFAYQNKDADCPHDFERKAVGAAKAYLATHGIITTLAEFEELPTSGGKY